jgi:hypothetical protein
MRNGETAGHIAGPIQAPRMLSYAAWITGALLLGCVFALSGIAGLFAGIALAALVVFASIVARYPAGVLCACIWALAMFPFNFGIGSGGALPKIFASEILLLLYLVTFPFLYLFTGRSWRTGFASLYAALALFLVSQALAFTVGGTDLISSRNFIETDFLSTFLLIVFLQEGANVDLEKIGETVVWVTVVIAALSIVEQIAKRNPFLENQTDITYLSPSIAMITEGVYRPYVSFFHPSETGTFMALGVPLAMRRWMLRKSWLSVAMLLLIAAGLFVNATRGCWFGVAIALLMLIRNAWVAIAAITPLAGVGGAIGYVAFKNTPFMQRLTDPNNLLSRFEYWKLAFRVTANHPLLGVGHMQFKEVYLDYVQDLSNVAHFDIAKIFAIDNMYLTVMAEHGLLGIFTRLILFLVAVFLLQKYRKQLLQAGAPVQASFVHCSEVALIVYCAIGFFADTNQFAKATKYVFILVALGLAAGSRYMGSETQPPLEPVTATPDATPTANPGSGSFLDAHRTAPGTAPRIAPGF